MAFARCGNSGLTASLVPGPASHPALASGRTRITRDLAHVVVVAVANGAAQGPHDLSGIVVGSLDVHRLAFETEGDIAVAFPGTEMARASRGVRGGVQSGVVRPS